MHDNKQEREGVREERVEREMRERRREGPNRLYLALVARY